MKEKRRKRIGNEGFTLLEILLVVAIIGILATAAMIKIGGKSKDAMVARAQADVRTIGLAVGMYELDTGSYPPSLQALVQNAGSSTMWKGPYLDGGSVPPDPWGNAYTYQVPGSHNPYGVDIYSKGAPDGTTGEIGNWQKK